jgi:hypothetical protein
MNYQFDVESAWFPVHESPKPRKDWFRKRYEVLAEWLDENTPEWKFRAELDNYAYASIYSFYRIVVQFDEEDDAFLYKMRW